MLDEAGMVECILYSYKAANEGWGGKRHNANIHEAHIIEQHINRQVVKATLLSTPPPPSHHSVSDTSSNCCCRGKQMHFKCSIKFWFSVYENGAGALAYRLFIRKVGVPLPLCLTSKVHCTMTFLLEKFFRIGTAVYYLCISLTNSDLSERWCSKQGSSVSFVLSCVQIRSETRIISRVPSN